MLVLLTLAFAITTFFHGSILIRQGKTLDSFENAVRDSFVPTNTAETMGHNTKHAATNAIGPTTETATNLLSLSASTKPKEPVLTTLAFKGKIYDDLSPCGLAKWRLSDSVTSGTTSMCPLPKKLEDGTTEDTTKMHLKDVKDLQPYDTLFVHQYDMKQFVDEFLDKLSVDIVVLTEHEPKFDPADTERVLENPRVVYVFSQNPWKVHPKLKGLPQGIARLWDANDDGPKVFQSYVQKTLEPSFNKSTEVFLSFFTIRNNRRKRRGIPKGPRRQPEDFYRHLMEARFVFSPDGDRPDCLRHWEAIGLGTVPITQLKPELYGFVEGAVFEYGGPWDVDEIPKLLTYQRPDQRLIFDEHWMWKMESIVGQTMGWHREDWREWAFE